MFALFPEILQQSEKGDIEMLACLVRKYFGENQIYSPRLRVGDLFQNAGINLRQDSLSGVARLEAWDHKGQYTVTCSLNPQFKDPYEQNYALAHLLGHVFLDLHPKMAKGELQRSIFEKKQSPLQRFLVDSGKRSKQEEAADIFACALLLPRGMLKKALSKLSATNDVAAFFQVLPSLLERRLEQLGGRETPAARAQSTAPQVSKSAAPQSRVPQSSPKQAAPSSKPDAGQKPLAARPPTPEAKLAPKTAEVAADPSSMTRVKRNVAALSYRREDQRAEATEASPKEEKKGLERLRKLAKKIDKSVDV